MSADDLFSHVNVNTIEATVGSVLIHAGAVVTPNGLGVVLPAPSGSGKSALVAGLVRAGFGYLSDEAAVFDPVSGLLHPYPTHLSLKAASRDRFPEARPVVADIAFSDATWHVDPDAIRQGAVAPSCEVGFVIPHRYAPGAETMLEPLTSAEACVELVQNLMLGRREVTRSLELIAGILSLVGVFPAHPRRCWTRRSRRSRASPEPGFAHRPSVRARHGPGRGPCRRRS